MAVLVYCMTADASNELRRNETSTPEASRSEEGDKSNMDLEVERGDFHSYEGEEEDEPLEEGIGAGRKDQAEEGSLYKSRSEGGEVMAWILVDVEWQVRVSERSHVLVAA